MLNNCIYSIFIVNSSLKVSFRFNKGKRKTVFLSSKYEGSNNLECGDYLTMGYFDNLDNRFSNKYEKNLKIEKVL
jgi:hypothetical protein